MQGSRRFSKERAEQIVVLLARTRQADRPRQKALRQEIRDLGFYISDFNRPATGFGPDDFHELVRTGQITII